MYESIEKQAKTYNTTITTNAEGEIINVYRKTHLYDAFNFKESDYLLPSDNKLQIFEYNGFMIGTMVCYEVRFPEMVRTLALKGAEVIVVPSAWVRGYNKKEHWLTLVKTRALGNTVYLVSSNQIGNIYTWISCFVDPFGLIVQRATDQEGLILDEASKDRLNRVRELLPVLAQRNRAIYDV